MKINTNKLKEKLDILSKAVGNNKLIPITSMIGIKTAKTESNKILLHTTDATNYLTAMLDVENIEGLELDVTITFDTFYKLITKTTTDLIVVTDKDKYLEVSANGTYKFDKLLTEEGNYYSFKSKSLNRNDNNVEEFTINKVDVEKIKKVNTPSLATTLELPALTGYYVGNKVVSSDSFVMTQLNKEIVTTPIILSSKVIDIASALEKETLKLNIAGNDIAISTDEYLLVSSVVDTVNNYPINDIDALMNNSEFKGTAKISIKSLLDTIDRLSLFVTTYDNQAINLSFTGNKLVITSKSTNGVEMIDLEETNEMLSGTDINCSVNIEYMKKELSSIDEDKVEVCYGNENFVTFKTAEVTKYICTLEE